MPKLTLEERKSLAEKKLKDLNDAIKAKALKDKSKEGVERRKRENRMKYLLGAFYLPRLQTGGVDLDGLNRWLVSAADRALFGLEPLAPPTKTADGWDEPTKTS
jgi:hypothetical protein